MDQVCSEIAYVKESPRLSESALQINSLLETMHALFAVNWMK